VGTSDVWYGVVTSRGSRAEPRIRVTDHPFFRGMDPDWVELASRGSVETTYDPGELIVREGELAQRFHLIFHGEVSVEIGRPWGTARSVQIIGSGEVLDWSGVVPPFLGQFDGRALKETRVVSLDSTVLRRLLEMHPADGNRFLERLIPVIGRRLEDARHRLVEGPDA